MEHNLELKNIPRNQQILGKAEKILSPRVSQSIKVQDRLKSEKLNLSYADLRHEITKGVDNILPKSLGNHQKQLVEGKATEEEELVKYMSNLPSYLERGELFQEKALSFGVLDWGRLKKWQSDHKQIPDKSTRNSSSSSNSSSLFSADESSTQSSRGHSCSPARQRIRRPTLQAHLKASTAEDLAHGVKFFGENTGKFQDLNAILGTSSSGMKTNQSSCKIQSQIRQGKCKISSSEPKAFEEMGTTNLEICEMASCSKGNMKDKDANFAERKGDSQEPNIIFKDCRQKYETLADNLLRDLPKNGHTRLSQFPGSSTVQGSAAASRRSFSEQSHCAEVRSEMLCDNIPRSCPFPGNVDKSKASQIKQPSSMDLECLKFPFDRSVCPPNLVRSKTIEAEKPTMAPTNSAAGEPSEGSDLKKRTVAAAKVRNPSHTRRLSISMSKIIRSSSSKDGLAIRPLISSNVCMDSSSDGQNATSRARFSPLRRLLDPLLKPKAGHSHQIPDPTQKDLTVSFNEQLDPSNSGLARVKLNPTSCGTMNVNNSYQNGKHRSLPVQALLQVAVKNGFPLFTFAVEGDKDILAATMKRCTTGKDDYCWIYTFFTINEVKRKNRSWINQGQNGKGHGYIPNVVAQMKVSDSQFLRTDQLTMREFVLFSVNLRQDDEQTSNIQPNDELAAIVVKIPKETETSYLWGSVSNDNAAEAKVILPSGVHSLPNKGEPSRLLERWKSGGACDCGGWDMGCRLRVLVNQNNKHRTKPSRPTADRFELFSLEGVVEADEPMFSMSRFKDGIYSAEFKPSLSLLQAFSTCLAVLYSRKQPSEMINPVEERSEELIKAGCCNQAPAPASYVSYPPPLSPVGRV